MEERRITKVREANPNGSVEILQQIVADYDRRKSTRWGRFLLWLLRNTT